MKHLLIIVLAAACGGALADGTALIKAAPALPANDAKVREWKEHPAVVKVHPITFDRLAFGANILTVAIDGKEYRFVGSVQPSVTKGYESWAGKEGSGSTASLMSLTRETKSGQIMGSITMPGRNFRIDQTRGRWALVETDPSKVEATRPYTPPSAPAFTFPGSKP